MLLVLRSKNTSFLLYTFILTQTFTTQAVHASAVTHLSLGIPKSHQWIGSKMGHLELLSRPDVYRQVEAWLQDGA